jgi:serine/threonine-protein kinase
MPPPALLAPGTRLRSYEILEHLGTGGMGVVYRAFDTRLERTVAIKLLRDVAGGDEGAALIMHEARAASMLNHPNICIIYEVCETCDQPFIAMEHVEGRTLLDVIPQDGLPLETTVRYGIQIADALSHAHDRGVVHRDLKTTNIRITADGVVKLLDFGLAVRRPTEVLEGDTRSWATPTDHPVMAGTLAYMSPEVLRGEPGDARSDLWALGVILHEMATGSLPFRSSSHAELVSAILRDQPAPLPPRVPASLRGIIARCLVKEPGRRYARGSEVRAALEAVHLDDAAHALRRAPSGPPPARSRTTRISALAVLPLMNLSRDPEQDYLADGMTEALILDLSKLSALRVTSRTSVMRYKNTTKSVPEIAAELAVDAVLEGSVQRAGDRVRITAQLIHGGTDAHLWSESYDRDLSDILAVQSEVAQAITREIKVKVSKRERVRMSRVRRVDPSAHEAYLKGRYQWNVRTAQSLRRAIEHFEDAIAKDPTFAPAQAALASAYVPFAFFGYMSPKKANARARSAALAALALDDGLAEAHTVLGAVNHDVWSWAAAESEYRRAISLDPTYPTAHQWFAEHLMDRGRADEAFAQGRQARELDPLSLPVNALIGYLHYFSERYDEAIAECRSTLKLNARFPTALWVLGLSLMMSGRTDEGVAVLEEGNEVAGVSRRLQSSLGWAYGRAGKPDRARALLRELEAATDEDVDFAYDVALVTLGLGDAQRAFEWLEKGFEGRSIYFRHVAADPRWKPLADESGYRSLVRKVGLR